MADVDGYSTWDVADCLDVQRGRLREWLILKYVKAKHPARGAGYPARFSREDIIFIGLFSSLVDQGIDREQASNICKEFQSELEKAGDVNRLEVLSLRQSSGPPIVEAFLDSEKEVNLSLETGTVSPIRKEFPEWDSLTIVNFGKLRRKTDAALRDI